MTDAKKPILRNARGEVIYKIGGTEFIFKPTMSVIDKIQTRFGSIFEMLEHFDGSGSERGRAYKIQDIIDALRILTADAITLDDEALGEAILGHGMMRFEAPITAVLMDVLLTGTERKGKGAGKLAS